MDVIEAYLTAARLDQLTATLRARALLTSTLAQALTWNSLGGVAFRARADRLHRDLLALCGAVDALAQAVRARAA